MVSFCYIYYIKSSFNAYVLADVTIYTAVYISEIKYYDQLKSNNIIGIKDIVKMINIGLSGGGVA